ncbi:MAG: M50 family metallopeptidase [Anaerolineae bacterium]
MGLVAFVVVFSLIILSHELGHFFFAKLFGVTVEEFGLGYPPRIARLGTWRGTELTLNALPFGGFVRIPENDPNQPGNLSSKSRTVRALVFAGGAIMNVVLAVVMFTVMYMVGTLVPVDRPGAGIYYVATDSPAAQAGLQAGDNLVSIDGLPVTSVDNALELVAEHAGQPMEIVIERDGVTLPPITTTPRENPPENEGALGVALDVPLERQSFPIWQAIPKGFEATWNAVRGLYVGIRSIIQGLMPLQLTGVVGIYSMTSEVAKSGISQLIEFTGWLSLNIFLFQLLPLPGLDGGHLIFVLLEWVRGGRKIPPEKEGVVHAVGMGVLIVMMLVVTVMDTIRLIG